MDLFDLIHRRKARAGGQFMFEGFDALGRTFGQHFNAAVIQVLHVTCDLMSRGGALHEETISHALHLATDEKPTRN